MYQCNKCNRTLSTLQYRIKKNGSKHLVGLCDSCGWRYISFVDDLDIETVDTKAREKEKKQPTLF